MTPRRRVLILSCEHATNRVPPGYARLLPRDAPALRTHRAWDPGSATLARTMARALDAPLVQATWTRLLVDANRTPTNPAAFSEFTRDASPVMRRRLLRALHRPHWAAVARLVGRALARHAVAVHVGVHSFTPVRHGKRRTVDVGILYDPARPRELAFALAWQRALAAALPRLRVHRNRPYLGSSDGMTTALRRQMPSDRYLGLELEVSQRLVRGAPGRWRAVQRLCAETLRAVLAAPGA